MHDLNDMYYFAKVIEHKGFMAASRALGIPKSRLSRRIKDLEIALNVRLLHRTTRKLALTDAGKAFLRHCEAIIDEATVAREEIERIHAVPRGYICVSAPMAIAQFLLAPVLPKFMMQYPEIRVSLEVTHRRVDLIEEGIDIAIRVRSGQLENSSLVIRTLSATQLMAVASPTYLRQYGTPVAPHELINHPVLTQHQPNGQYTWCFTSPTGQVAEVNLHPKLMTDDMVVLREVALAGQGIVVLPRLMVREALQQNQLKVILSDWQLPRGLLHAVYPSRRGLLPAVRVFLDFLSAHTAEYEG
jgi:DNA-binding transcriptional LysR family regulator